MVGKGGKGRQQAQAKMVKELRVLKSRRIQESRRRMPPMSLAIQRLQYRILFDASTLRTGEVTEGARAKKGTTITAKGSRDENRRK